MRFGAVEFLPEQSMNRFYRASLQPDLFGGCSLIREWGRIGSGGRLRCDDRGGSVCLNRIRCFR